MNACRNEPSASHRAGYQYALAFLIVFGMVPVIGPQAHSLRAETLLPTGEPDPTSPDLRLWLRADSGIKDGKGIGVDDPAFSGSVMEWGDRSAHKYNLTAMQPERAPLFVARQAAAGNQPVVSFAGRQILTRAKDLMHDRAESTTIVVLQQQAGSGNTVYSVGQGGNFREFLNLPPANALVSCPTVQSWLMCSAMGEREIGVALPVAGDPLFNRKTPRVARAFKNKDLIPGQTLPGDGGGEGRLRICWLNCSDRISAEHHDGSGEFLGGLLTQAPIEMKPSSLKCLPEFTLGGLSPAEPNFSGQIAEVLIFNKSLSLPEKRSLLGYLRGRYGLNAIDPFFPTDALLLSLGDFTGPWPISAGGITGRLAAAAAPIALESMKMTVEIPHDGDYFVWVRAMENPRGQQGNFTAVQTSVQGTELDVTHTVGPGGVCWRLAGKPSLKKGAAEILIRGVGPGNKNCEAVFISPYAETSDSVEAQFSLAQRLRQMGGTTNFVARFLNGFRLEGNPLQGWRWSDASGKVANPDPAKLSELLCVQFDSPQEAADSGAEMAIEFHNGDSLRGRIIDYQTAASQPVQPSAAQLIVRTQPMYISKPEETFSLDLSWVRRIVLDKSRARNCPPQSLACRDGRLVSFQSIRWGADSVSILTEEGVERLSLRDVAEICLAGVDPWETYYRELAALNPAGLSTVVQVETLDGMRLTSSSNRFSLEISTGRRSIQPVWCRTAITLPPQTMRSVWQAAATVVPLSRLSPQTVVQRSSLGNSWKWKLNRNVTGDILRSGGSEFLWGFGVHAPNELTFLLPECAQSFRSSIGIDSTTGSRGAAAARVYMDDLTGKPLYQSKLFVGGSYPLDTGLIALPAANGQPRRLVLVADTTNDTVRKPEDILDIGAHFDWLEPIVFLDPALLQAEVVKQATVGQKLP